METGLISTANTTDKVHRSTFIWLTALALVLLGGHSTAQRRGFFQGSPTYFESQVHVASSRQARQNIAQAKKDLAAGELERCVRLIQEILNGNCTGSVSEKVQSFQGVREFCIEFLRGLPKEGLEAYRAHYDPIAAQLHKEALATSRTDLLTDLFLRYPVTSSGAPALRDAVSLQLEQGELQAAIDHGLLYRESIPGLTPSRATVNACLALAYSRTGDTDRLRSLRRSLETIEAAAELTIAGEKQEMGRWMDALVADLEAMRKTAEPIATGLTHDILVAEGWRSDIPNLNDTKRHLYSQYDDFGRYTSSSAFPWNPMRPIAVDGAVFISTGVQVHAFDLYSGSLRWTASGLARVAQASRNRRIEMPLAVDRGLVFAALETPVRSRRTLMNYTPQVAIAHRRLNAFDATSGKAIWSHNTTPPGDAETKEFIKSLNITSSPVVHGEDLFVNATRFHTSYHSYLCCFERLTGRLKWATFVSTGQMEQNMFGNPVREAVSGQVTLHEGVLYFTTNMGVVAAVDARLGTLRFVTTYKQIGIPRATRYAGVVQERAPGWANCPPIVADGRVFVSPQDSHSLLAIDIKTGASQVVTRRTSSDRYRYILGPFNHRICVAGRRVAFFNTQTLQRDSHTAVGREEIQEGVRGWPVISGDRLFAPIMSFGVAKMFVWDLTRLKVIADEKLSAVTANAALGNLFLADGALGSAASGPRRTYIVTHYDADRIRAMVAAESRQDPLSPTPFLRLGALSLQSKNYDEALAAFQEALRLSERPESNNAENVRYAKQALFDLYIKLSKLPSNELEVRGLDAFACLEKALPYAFEDVNRIEIYFQLMKRSVLLRNHELVAKYADQVASVHGDIPYDYVGGFEVLSPILGKGRYDQAGLLAKIVEALSAEHSELPKEAVDAWQQLIGSYGDRRLNGQTIWSLGRTRIATLIKNHTRSLYSQYDQKAKALFVAAENRRLTPLRKLVNEYPNSTHVKEAYALMTRILIEAGQPEMATSITMEGLSRLGEVEAHGLHALADALDAGGCTKSATSVWELAATIDPRHTVRLGETVKTTKEVWLERLDSSAAAHAKQPVDLKPVSEEPDWTVEAGQSGSTWKLIQTKGDRPDSCADVLLAREGEILKAIDVASGQLIWTFSDEIDSDIDLLWFEGRLILDQGGQICAVDPLKGTILWRSEKVEGYITDFCAAPGQVIMLTDSPAQGTSSLRSVSVQDGSHIQEIKFNSGSTHSIQSHGPWILVRMDSPALARVFNAFTFRDAPGFENGQPFDLNAFLPFFNEDGRVVSVNPGRYVKDKRITARDPRDGTVFFSRPLGDGAVVFRSDENQDTLTYELVKRTSPRIARTISEVICVDLKTGSATTRHTLPERVRVRRGGALRTTTDDVYIVARRTQATSGGIRLEYWVRDVDRATSQVKWETLRFTNVQDLSVQPLGSTVLLSVTEARRKRNLTINRSMLYLADAETGSIKTGITLEHLTSSVSYSHNVSVMNGRLVVADGPSLKVYKP